MKNLLLAGVVTAGLTLSAATASAAVIGTTPGPFAPLPNNIIGAVEGWFGAHWYLFAGAATTIDVYYLGVEAGAWNSFAILGTTVQSAGGGANTGLSTLFGGTTVPVLVSSPVVSPGLIDFSFTTNLAGGATVTNAGNVQPPVSPNFFSTVTTCGALATCVFDTTINGSTASGGNTLLLALDDGGAGPDDNHDDLVMVIKIAQGDFRPVPEPATLGLLGAGLLGLGFAARRRRA